MAQFNTFDLGNVLSRGEQIKGFRQQNILGRQKIDANALLQQRSSQFQPLLQNFLQTGGDANALIQANPELAEQVFAAQSAQTGAQQEGFDLKRDQAERSLRLIDSIKTSRSPFTKLSLLPEDIREDVITELLQNVGKTSLSEVTVEELFRELDETANELRAIAGPEVAQAQATLESTRVRTAIDVAAEGRAGRTEVRNITKERVTAKREESTAMRAAAKAAREVFKAKTVEEKRVAGIKSSIEDSRATAASTRRLASHPGLDAATGKTGAVPAIPGSDKANFIALVETVKARLGFAELAKMRAASPTGGALGQISEKEISFLQAANQSLDRKQSAEQFRENLNLVLESLQRLTDVQQEALTQGQTEDVPEGLIDNGDGTFTLPDGRIVERE